MNYRKVMLRLLTLGGLALVLAPLSLSASAPALAVSCEDSCGGGGTGGGGGGASSTGTVVCSAGYIANTNVTDNWVDAGIANVNDVAAGLNGSVWYITGTPGTTGTTGSLTSGAVINHGGKRLAVDPQGNPWIVDFDGHIWRLVNGSFQELPTGLARDIGVAPNGTVWVIGTNSRNGSFQVWSWNGSTWTANAGSGEEIDVAANGDPVVNGYDGKVWIMDGGPDSGWSQVGISLSTFDMGLSPCSPSGQASVGGSAMWLTSGINFSPSFPPIVFSDGGGLEGPYSTFNSGPVVEQFTTNGQVNASHVAVDTTGRVWAVADPWGCDCPGELLERPLN